MPPSQRRRGQRRPPRRSERPPSTPAPQLAGLGSRSRRIPRSFVAIAGVLMAVALIVAGLFVVVRGTGGGSTSCDPDAAGWNGAGGGPRQTGLAPGAIHDPKPGWRPSWQYPAAGAPASDRVAAPPSEANGSVYTATADGTLVALDPASGRRRWTSAPGQGERGRVAVPIALDGCAAAVATAFQASSGQPAGALRAVDLRTHQVRWAVLAADEIFSAPQVVDGVAYAGLSFGTTSGPLDRIHVLDGYYLNDGSAAYRKRFSAAILASPTSDHERIWIGDLDQNLYALGPGGRQLWTYTTGGIISVPAVYDGSSVVVDSADRHVAALDPASGREKWTTQVGEVQAAMAESSGEVLVAEVGGTVHAFGAADGSERWHRDVGARVSRAVVAAGDRVFVVDDGGTVHVLDAATGAETASWTAPAPPAGAPAIAAGHLYLTCRDGRLYALPL